MNSYSFLDPVTREDMFYGYQEEMDYIVKKVIAPGSRRQSFFVDGGSRMGKTSLLLQIERHLRQSGIRPSNDDSDQLVIIPLYLDMLDLDPTLNGFLGRAALLLESYPSRYPIPFDISSRAAALLQSVKTHIDPFVPFTGAIYELEKAARPRQLRVVLLTDDLWRIRQQGRLTLARTLRALHIETWIQHAMAFVITGSSRDWGESLASPLENTLVYKELHVLDEKDALKLINKPTEEKIPPQVALRVYRETGGHPFLLQYVMSTLCDQEDIKQLTEEDVDQATKKFQRERRDFEHWWKRMSEVDKKVYRIFRKIGPETGIAVDEFVDMGLSVNKLMLLDSLRALKTTGLIREYPDNHYWLAGLWPARWFQEMR